MIQNPILRGFCPDPSIIRSGDDYYIATSTFEWWPGVKLFHSRDLKHWNQLPSPLRRSSQLNLLGDPTSGGVWAPCLSYDGSRYYLVFTDVKTKKGRFYNTHNYLVYTEDIAGDWSEPVYLNSIGFDPSLFHDRDGRKYLINMVNGFKGILVQEIEPGTFRLKGERKKVYAGSGIGCTEGPHMYHIGDWYYLITAEGGTGYEHCVTLARSKSIWGPFETAPDNPILTSCREKGDALQKCGHADLVDTPGGEWYLAHLCARPLEGQQWCILGRETALQKVVWNQEGWLCLEEGGRYAGMTVPEPDEGRCAGMKVSEPDEGRCAGMKVSEPDIERHAVAKVSELDEGRNAGETAPEPEEAECSGDKASEADETGEEKDTATPGFWDDFHNDKLNVRYVSPRVSYESFTDTRVRKGYLRMKGQESMNSLHHVSLLAVSQQEVRAGAETAVEFEAECPEQLAGLAYMYDAMNYYILGKTAAEEGGQVLVLIKSDTGVVTDEILPIPLPSGKEVGLKAVVSENGKEVRFFYRCGEEAWKAAGEGFTTGILTDEHCRGFTGAHFGMYIHDMAGLNGYADYSYFKVEYD